VAQFSIVVNRIDWTRHLTEPESNAETVQPAMAGSSPPPRPKVCLSACLHDLDDASWARGAGPLRHLVNSGLGRFLVQLRAQVLRQRLMCRACPLPKHTRRSRSNGS